MDFESFRQALLDALVHLHDPGFQPAPSLYAVTGCEPGAGPGPVQAHIARDIESLRPDDSLPRSSRAWREYQVLVHRSVLGLSVEESAEGLYLARRTLQRVQREALQALFRHLWEAWQTRQATSIPPMPGPAAARAG